MLSNKEKELDILTEFLKSFENICMEFMIEQFFDPFSEKGNSRKYQMLVIDFNALTWVKLL